MRRIVVEVQVLVAGVRHPIEMTERIPYGNPLPQAPSRYGTDHFERDVGEDGHAEGERGHGSPMPSLRADLDLAQRPGDECTRRRRS